MRPDKCEVPRCRDQVHMYYLGKGVCWKHWCLHCSGDINLKKIFKIEEPISEIDELINSL